MSKDAILEAAAVIFSQKGYHAASMQDIAQAVRLQKASLYHHVNSKQEILKALLDKALELLIQDMQEVVLRPIPSDEKLKVGMCTYLTNMLEHRELASVLLLEHRSLEAELRARHIPRRDEFEQLWRDLIQEGCDNEVFTSIDVDMTTRYILGILNWTITWYQPDAKFTPAEIGEMYADLVLEGLKRKEKNNNSPVA